MYSQIESISPARASTILATQNSHNRPLSPERVRSYAKLMTDGLWYVNPQGIAFDVNAVLINGQHTLNAIVLSGVTLDLYVHRKCPAGSQIAMDQGLPRTAAQIFSTEFGHGGSRYVAPARTVLELGLEVGKASNTAIVDWAQKHSAVIEKYLDVGRVYTAGTHAAFVFAELLGYQGVRAAADRLLTFKWDTADEADPMCALAKALRNMGARDGATSKKTRFFTTINALKAIDSGRSLRTVKKQDTMPPRVRESVRPGMAA